MPFFNRGRIKLNKTFFNSFGSGGGPIPPLPPIRPNSYLKYTFSQRDLTAAITDRVSNSDILTTTIGTDVNAVQTIDGGIRTFEFGENLLPASLLAQDGNPAWTGTGGEVTGSPIFTDDTGLGEVEFSATVNTQRNYLFDVFQATEGDNTFSVKVLDGGSIAIRPIDVLFESGAGTAVNYFINDQSVSSTTAIALQEGDIITAIYNYTSAASATYRCGLGCASGGFILGGMSIKLTKPMVNSGTERGPFVQPDGNPVTKYTQAFDVGVGALIEPSDTNKIINSALSGGGLVPDDWRTEFGTGIREARQSTIFPTVAAYYNEVQTLGERPFYGQNQTLDVGSYIFRMRIEEITTGFSARSILSVVNLDSGNSIEFLPCEANPSGSSTGLIGVGILKLKINILALDAVRVRIGIDGAIDQTIGSCVFSMPQIDKNDGSFIITDDAEAQRDASTPQVTGTAIPDSRVSVFTEFIANADNPTTNPVNIAELQFTNDNIVIGYTYAEVLPLFLANSFFVTNPTGDFVIEYTPDQVIQKGDHIKIDLYINDVSVALAYENKTNGEKGILQNTSVFLDLGVGDIIKLGETDALSANYMTMVDFEVTAYTAPVIPDFADNGDFAQNGDFA